MIRLVVFIVVSALVSMDRHVLAQTPEPCPAGYENGFSGRCYLFQGGSSELTTWSSARESCQQDSADSDLVIIDSDDELNYIKGRTTAGTTWWIGFSDLSVEGLWRWVDCNESTPWQESLWATGQPSSAGEDCAAFQNDNGLLAGYDCDSTYGFICEVSPKEFTLEDTNAQTVDASAVDSDETAIQVTWEVSPYNCDITGYRIYYHKDDMPSINGSVLISGGNASEATVSGLTTNTMWVVYVSAIHSINGELEVVGPANAWLGPCPEWHLPGYNGSCYWFYIETGGENWWYYKRRSCVNRGSDLLIINSQEELDYILSQTETLAPGQAWWIGYTDISVEGAWRWMDCSTPSDWQSSLWASGEPEEAEDCSTLQGDSGEIVGQPCDQRFFFICELSPKEFTIEDTNVRNLDAVAVNETIVLVTWDVSPYNCDIFGYRVYYEQDGEPSNAGSVTIYDGNATEVMLYSLTTNVRWQIYVAALQVEEELDKVGPANVWLGPCPEWHVPGYDGNCYWFYHETGGENWWYYKRRSCLNRGSELLIVDSREELDYILNRTETLAPGRGWWIGFTDISVEGGWLWMDCSFPDEWHSSLWATGEPAEADDCAILQGDTGEIVGQPCDQRFFFICKVSPKKFTREDTYAKNVDAVAVNETTIRVTWDVSRYNCDIFGYRVYYEQDGEPGNTGSVHVYGGDADEVMLYSLTTNVRWQIYVAALQIEEELDKVGPANVWLGPCPEWHLPGYDGNCYWFYHETGGENWWYYKRRSCLNRGSELLIVDSREELDYILNRTETLAPGRGWWIGFTDISVEGGWLWMDCSFPDEWHSSLWATGEPAEADDCAILQGDTGEIVGQPCDQRFFFICKVSPKKFTREDTYPKNVDAVAVNETTIRVTWDVSRYNCDIFGYRVYYEQDGELGNTGSVNVYGGGADEVMLYSLTTNVRWQIYVAALQIEEELDKVGPANVWLGPCPEWHLPGPNGSCYWFFSDVNETSWWIYARGDCLSRGSDLVIINSQAELDYILSQTETLAPGQSWWIGYYDVSVEGTWQWMDCSPTDDWQSTLWAPNEPEEPEDCATLQGDMGEISGQLCDQKHLFICEVSPKEFTIEDTNVQGVAAEAVDETTIRVTWEVSPYNCDVFGYRVYYEQYQKPSNAGSVHVYGGNVSEVVLYSLTTDVWWEIYVAALQTEQELARVGPDYVWLGVCPSYHLPGPNGSCYWFSSDVNDTGWWGSVRSSCRRRKDSDLVIIDNQEELDYILNRTETLAPGQAWWIGYFDVSVEGAWQWVDCTPSDDWQSALWAPDEPAELEDCAALQGGTGEISGQVCDQNLLFICEVSPKDFDTEDTKPTDVAAVALTPTSIQVTWNVSMYACDIIGYRVHYEPTSNEGMKDWVIVYGGNVSAVLLTGLAVDTEYSIGVAAMNLEEELEQVGPVLVSTPWGCLGDYEERPGYQACYAFYNFTRMWATAREWCLDVMDGDLAIIDDEDELDYLLSRTGEINPGQTWWFGYYDASVEGVWRWVDCGPTTDWQAQLWPSDVPRVGPEDCAYVVQEGNSVEIRPSICDTRRHFVCEIIPKGFQPDDSNARNVRATPLTPGSFEVKWDVSPNNCDVIGYMVFYSKEATPSVEDSVTLYGGDIRDAEIKVTTVTQETVYLVSVAGLRTQAQMDRVGPARVTLSPESDNREYISLEGDDGTLTSPGWPAGYDDNKDITWTITVSKPGRVLLTIHSIRLDSRGDYLTIGSGSKEGSNQLEQYTGFQEDVGTLESESNQMWLRFVTDAAITAPGFSVSWERLEGGGSDCGAVFTDLPSGTITSPNFLQSYPNNADCVWQITLRDETAQVRLEFTTFDLETDQDFLIIGSGPTVNENTLMWLTGQLDAPSVESPTHQMWLRFLSDETVTRQGFRATFRSITGEPPTTPVYETEDTVVFVVFNQNVGWFSSVTQVQLASAIAEVLNRYNIPTSQPASRQQGVFDATDVVFVSFYNVGNDLHINTWVRDATSSANSQTPLDPSTVLEAVSAESEYFQDQMGPSFDYSVELPSPPTKDPTEPPSGLAEWVIAVIAVGLLLLLILMGLVIFGCYRGSGEAGQGKEDDVSVGSNEYHDFRPTSFSSDGTWNPAFQSAVEEAGDSTQVTVL